MHHRSWPTLLGILALSLALTGCERDEVQTYTVPRAGDEVGTGNTKLLVAIVPAGDDTWFFKLAGRADIIEMVEGSFHKLVDSLKYDGKALTWDCANAELAKVNNLDTGVMTPISFSATNHLAAPKLFLLKADPAAVTYKAVQ